MFLKSFRIEGGTFVTDIVTQDYRTAEVFRKYGIEYSSGDPGPLEMICRVNHIDLQIMIRELEESMKNIQVPNSLPFNEWSIDFLADYIVHVHHYYLKKNLPEIREVIKQFAKEHREKYSYLEELEKVFLQLNRDMIPHLVQEEEVLFPYIKQVAHAFESRESYASLLVRTLRKPVEEVMHQEHASMSRMIRRMRYLTREYTYPARASTSHRVAFSRLKELDNDLVQHMHLENNVLFPRAIELEKILLAKTS